MAIYEMTKDTINKLKESTFGAHDVKERQDLQRLLRDRIDIIADGVMVVAEEFGSFEDSQHRIDLLALDGDANLVVIELKRTMTGGRAELQALRYAAMVSTMTFDDVVSAHQNYLKKRDSKVDAKQAVLDHLEWNEPDEEEFAQEVRIVLVAADFSKELMGTVLWLNGQDLDIRCVRLKPYTGKDNQLLLDVQQVIPLPEAVEYQFKIKKKEKKGKADRKDKKDRTKFDVTVNGVTQAGLSKRRTMLVAIKGFCDGGVTPEEIGELIPWATRLWRRVDDQVGRDEFIKKAHAAAEIGGPAFDPDRWHVSDEDLIVVSGRTYALTNQWGRKSEDALKNLVAKYPDRGVAYSRSE